MKFLRTTLLAALAVASLPCSAAPTVRVVFGRGHQPKQSPLNEQAENANAFSYSAGNLPRIWNNDAKKAFLGVMACHFRLLNKEYDTAHMPFSDFVKNPTNIAYHPLRFLDDGIIGHMGAGNKAAYGILGTGWSWVPKIDQAMVRVDQTKRKVEAWFGWFNRNLNELNNASITARKMYDDGSTFIQELLPKLPKINVEWDNE